MKQSAFIFVLCVGLSLFFIASSLSAAQRLPVSQRSNHAVKRVRLMLEKDLRTKGLTWGAPLFIRIIKETKVLEVWLKNDSQFILFKSYPICTYGWKGLGPKMRQGDGRAPEGFYYVAPGQMNPYSRYHLAFNLGYPNAYDRFHGRTGSALMVHGRCVSIGCYAMTDQGMEEIYALADAALRNGQRFFRVHIFPFRMHAKNMKRHGRSPWIEFWRNLKQGYDFFKRYGYPPAVEVKSGRYRFSSRI